MNSAQEALKDTAVFDEYLSGRLSDAIDKFAPELKGVLSVGGATLRNYLGAILPELNAGEQASYRQLRQVGATYAAGQLPADVVAQIRQSSAQGAATRGLTGQAGSNLQARDLGLTTVELQKQGQQFLAAATATAGNLDAMNRGAISALGGYTSAAKSLIDGAFTSPDTLSNLTLQFSAQDAELEKARIADATNRAKIAADTAQFNASLAYEDKWSTINAKWANIQTQNSNLIGAGAFAVSNPGTAANNMISYTNDFNKQLANATTNILGGGRIKNVLI
jgi:hypothetical protein